MGYARTFTPPRRAGLTLGRAHALWPCGHAHAEMGTARQRLGSGHPPPPGVCCQATADGGTVCSDGFVGPAG